MKKYTRPTIEVVELSVKESLSALPGTFSDFGYKLNGVKKFGSSSVRNVSMYLKDSGNVTGA